MGPAQEPQWLDVRADQREALDAAFKLEGAWAWQLKMALLAYDEQVRHYADKRIISGLADGAEVKVVTGGAGDE